MFNSSFSFLSVFSFRWDKSKNQQRLRNPSVVLSFLRYVDFGRIFSLGVETTSIRDFLGRRLVFRWRVHGRKVERDFVSLCLQLLLHAFCSCLCVRCFLQRFYAVRETVFGWFWSVPAVFFLAYFFLITSSVGAIMFVQMRCCGWNLWNC